MRLNTLLLNPLKSIKGFTLVELSIVIVIIGLIIAAVSAGVSLVNAAKLRSVASEINQYKLAYNTFYLKYNSIPGDTVNAYSYWGAAAGCTNNLVSVSNGCNGNGERRAGLNNYASYSVKFQFGDEKQEDYKAWQFMALDGLIPGSYNGTYGQAFNVGVNVPVSAYKKKVSYRFNYAEGFVRWATSASTSSSVLLKNPGNFLLLVSLSATGYLQGPVLKTVDALSYDTKVDDGLPNTGMVMAYTGNPDSGSVTDHCANAYSIGSTAPYILSHQTVACALMVKMDR